MEQIEETPVVYGPVASWRLGRSLGVDLLGGRSTCSFRCVYCQLGEIEHVTTERREFVPTSRLIRELAASEWRAADVVTFSGSGEPTLASNLGEAIDAVREITSKPVAVLTNSTLLYRPEVRRALDRADYVFCKLDAWSRETLTRFDRPAKGITMEQIVSGIIALVRETRAKVAVQTMLLRAPNDYELEEFADLLAIVRPHEIQLNLPTRPVPPSFSPGSRGNDAAVTEGSRRLKVLPKPAYDQIARRLAAMTGLPVTAR